MQQALSYLPPAPSTDAPFLLTPESICLCTSSLRLINAIMSFDYSGCQSDGSCEEIELIQLPNEWSSTVCKVSILHQLLALYSFSYSFILRIQIDTLAPLATETLLFFTAIRRSLFTSPEATMEYYEEVLQCFLTILSNKSLLEDEICHSNTAQALAKFKINVQFGEMVKFKDFLLFFQAITQFAVNTITTRGYLGDFPYILILWSRILDALRFTSAPIYSFIPQDTLRQSVKTVCRAYVMTLIDKLDGFINDEESSPLSNIELTLKHEEKLSILLGFDYEYVFELIMSLFESHMVLLRTSLNQIQQQWNANQKVNLSNEESHQIIECDCISFAFSL